MHTFHCHGAVTCRCVCGPSYSSPDPVPQPTKSLRCGQQAVLPRPPCAVGSIPSPPPTLQSRGDKDSDGRGVVGGSVAFNQALLCSSLFSSSF